MPNMPDWTIPHDLPELIDAEEGGIWEDTRWEPILLSVMGGTTYGGRDIPLAWQIEFEPDGPSFEAPNAKIAALGLDPDGYGWAHLIQSMFAKYHPEFSGELQFGDTDVSACVVWVESETTCRLLIQLVWSLIHGS